MKDGGVRKSFSDEEWQAICHLPLLTAALISAVDYSSISEEREYRAYADFIHKTSLKRNRSDIIDALLKEMDVDDKDTFHALCHSVTGALSGDNPIDRAIANVKGIAKTVDARLPKDEAKSYKMFVLDIASAVARAHRENMMPFAGSVSRVEDFHIRRLEQALGV